MTQEASIAIPENDTKTLIQSALALGLSISAICLVAAATCAPAYLTVQLARYVGAQPLLAGALGGAVLIPAIIGGAYHGERLTNGKLNSGFDGFEQAFKDGKVFRAAAAFTLAVATPVVAFMSGLGYTTHNLYDGCMKYDLEKERAAILNDYLQKTHPNGKSEDLSFTVENKYRQSRFLRLACDTMQPAPK